MLQTLPDFERAGSGVPPIVLYGPAGAWQPIWADLAALTQVYRYDRGGLPTPVTALDLVAGLRAQLQQAGAAVPYVLIGHSFGGLVMQLYARLFPAEVQALMLLDSVHEQQVARFYAFSPAAGDSLVSEIAEVHQGLDYAACEKQLQAAPPLRRDLPLTVISRGRLTDVAPVWSALQAELAALSDRSTHLIATHSGHGIHFDEPELVVAAIQAAIDQARGA